MMWFSFLSFKIRCSLFDILFPPITGIFAPFFQYCQVIGFYIAVLLCIFEQCGVIRKRGKTAFSCFKIFVGSIETVGEYCCQPRNGITCPAERFYRLEAAFTRRYKIFYYGNTLAGYDLALYHFTGAMLFWFGANINKGQAKLLCHQSALWDARRCYACYHVNGTKFFLNQRNQLLADVGADAGM